MKISGCIKPNMKHFNWFNFSRVTCFGLATAFITGFYCTFCVWFLELLASQWTGPDRSRYSKSRVTVNTALSKTTGGEAEQHGAAAATQEMIQDLKTPPGVIFLTLYQ
ncbi:hypothetical protein AMECASPLE_027750 [Ameca splendens]|uniref:Uncharacterized protein n=1 Tax=Ameca splendens TaxID=208324 RepID=A0ABV0XIC3_9TELE